MTEEWSDLDAPIDALARAEDPMQMTQALQRHPELLKPEAQARLAFRVDTAAEPVERERLKASLIYLEAYHQQLNQAGFPEPLHWRIFTAQLYEHAYAGTRDGAYLNGALEWWLGILDSEDFRTAPVGFQLDALGSTAAVFLRRFQATRSVDDISSFIALIQKKIAMRPDADEVPMLFNNLGQAFTDRMSVQPSADDARASVEAFERAMAAAAEDDPERRRFSWGLCQARFNHYWYTLDPEDIRKGLEAADLASSLREQSLAPFLDKIGGALMQYAATSGHAGSVDAAIDIFRHLRLDSSLEPDARAVFAGRLGRALLERAAGHDDAAGLREAVEVLEEAAAIRTSRDAELTTIHSFLSDALGRSLELAYDPDLSARAAAHNRRALELAERLGEPTLQFVVRLARLHRVDFDHGGDPTDLDRARSLLAEALPLCEGDLQRRATVLGQLGSDLLAGHAHLGRRTDLESALSHLEEAVELAAPDHPNRPDFLNVLAVALRARYGETGAIDDLEQSISKSIEGIGLLPEQDRVRRARLENNVGLALVDRSKHRSSPEDLDEAIISFEYALATMSDLGAAVAERSNLGLALAQRARLASRPDDLDRAIGCFEDALERVDKRSPDRLALLHNLATALAERVERRWDQADADRALALVRSAIDASDAELPALPMYHKTLGDVLQARYDQSSDEADRLGATAAYRRGAELGLERAYELAMGNARAWLTWAYERAAWEEAREAYGLLATATEKLVQSQIFRRTKSIWLKEVQSLSAMAAYAMVQLDSAFDAAKVLEEGQARMLSESLTLEQIDLSSLEGTDHAALYEEYRVAVDRLRRASGSAPGAQVRLAHDRVQALNSEIRKIPGFEEFLMADRGSDLARAAAAHPLVYIAATPNGGLGVVVDDAAGAVSARAVHLPFFSEEDLDRRLYGGAGEMGYLGAYERWLDAPADADATRAWLGHVDSLAAWLWEAVIAPVEAAGIAEWITLVPIGRAALLPFHAAYQPESDSSAGRRLIDEHTVAYAPNARSIVLRAERARRLGDDPRGLGFAGVVASSNGPVLPNARIETLAAASHFGTVRFLQDSEATAASVIDALAEHDVAHFACHAQSDLGDPNRSVLLLGDEEELTVAQLLSTSDLELRLAFLSACETGRPGTTLPDEIIGLPSAMIAAGSCAVIASSWAVSDVAGLVLAIRFYDEWSAGAAPAGALRAAQRWMRESDWSTVLDLLTSKVESNALQASDLELVRRRAGRDSPANRPFAHVFFWGAFGYTGL